MTLITKGAHPGDDWLARLTPKDVRDDLHDSLRRLETDVVDIYSCTATTNPSRSRR